MTRLADPNRNKNSKSLGRREFLISAFATTSLAATHLRAEPSLSLARLALKPMLDVVGSGAVPKALVTPNADFFIRNHFKAPTIDEDKWALEIVGKVDKTIKLSYSDLLLASSVRTPLTLECAGNLSGGGGVGTAVWTGVPLETLLKQAGVQAGASVVVLHGADSGDGEGVPPGTHFARAIPLEKAMAEDSTTMLAYEMNGAPLPPEHGFPLRALVSGWYGMDSVKWLNRIEVSSDPFDGYFQQQRYVEERSSGERRPITRMRINSKFIRPLNDEEIHGKSYRLEGVAWAGENKVSTVELRFDGNGAWQAAILNEVPVPRVWTPWSYAWEAPRAGQHSIEVRATDDAGNTQPLARDSARKDEYELNTPHRIVVKVS
jgi:DMSO/TMAO reductase YedYZ molybdopterin-dependent catalytic subunit